MIYIDPYIPKSKGNRDVYPPSTLTKDTIVSRAILKIVRLVACFPILGLYETKESCRTRRLYLDIR
jgi:hypothetical protein